MGRTGLLTENDNGRGELSQYILPKRCTTVRMVGKLTFETRTVRIADELRNETVIDKIRTHSSRPSPGVSNWQIRCES